MSEKVKVDTNADAVNNNTSPPAKLLDSKTIKQNNDLKNRLRKYIKKLDGKTKFHVKSIIVHLST